jgi:hypothetical protein
VYHYWLDSLAWRTPFNPDHVAGYPLLIALLTFLTANRIEPTLVLLGITFFAHIAGALAVYSSVASQASERVCYLCVGLFVLWPFVGTTYAAFPMSDSIALACLAWGVSLLLKERLNIAAIPLGFAAVIHKGTWIFVIFLILAAIVRHRRLPWAALIIASLPLGLLWAAGMAWNGYGPAWLLSVSLPIQFATKSNLPVLDGLVGTALLGGTKYVFKSIVLWAHVALLAALLFAFIKETHASAKWYGLAIVGGLFFLYIGLNHNIVWAAVRYSKIAALPIGFYLGTHPRAAEAISKRIWSIVVVMVLLLTSQFAFSLYIARVFPNAK